MRTQYAAMRGGLFNSEQVSFARNVDLAALAELDATSRPCPCGVLPHLLRQLHRAELRTAHRAEVRDLGAVGRQRLVVEGARGHRIERQVELVLPAELEARLRQRVVPRLRPRMALGEIGGVRGDLVGDDAAFTSSRLGRPRCSFGVT